MLLARGEQMQGFITQSFKSDNPVDWYHTGHAFSSFGIGVFGYPFGVWSQNCSSASLAPFMMWTSKGVVAHRSSPVPSPVSDALLNAFRT